VDDKFSDIKDRLTRIEGKDMGHAAADTSHQAGNTNIIAIISAVIGAVAVIVANRAGGAGAWVRSADTGPVGLHRRTSPISGKVRLGVGCGPFPGPS
jgi:hypothetical protein